MLRNNLIVRLIITVMLAVTGFAGAGEKRGIWWWVSPDHAWGTGQVIGKVEKETAILGFLKQWKIGQVYVSFSPNQQKHPEAIRGWNARCHQAGIQSQLLLSENTWIYPNNRENLLKSHIQKELVNFNATCGDASQRYDGLHLDIEPHGFAEWKTMTPADRKGLLILLGETFREVRNYLDGNGAAALPVFADLPVWYDQVGNPVGWASDDERNQWFSDLGRSLAGITLMAYERDTSAKIESGVKWEISKFKGEVRVGLETNIGTKGTWKTFDDFRKMIRTQESIINRPRSVDIHDFVGFHDAAALGNASQSE